MNNSRKMRSGGTLAIGLLLAGILLSAEAKPPRYAAGQIWTYHTRPQDAGSLLKIQRIEPYGSTQVYHISVVGVHFANQQLSGELPHLPVSEATLDNSVIALAPAAKQFPDLDVDAGIAQWRAAKGGIFTITIAEAVSLVEQAIAGQQRN